MQSAFGIDKLVICGEYIPAWLTNFEIIHFADIRDPRRKEENIYNKIRAALARYPEIIFANDDHFVSDHFDPIFYFKSGTLADKMKVVNQKGYYYKTLINTAEYVFSAASTGYFDVHCPIVYVADKFPFINFSYFENWGICLKTAYCRFNLIPGVEIEDCKLRAKHKDYSGLDSKLFFSSHESVLCPAFIEYLQKRWPVKSQFEK